MQQYVSKYFAHSLIWVQAVCKGYQQSTVVSWQRVEVVIYFQSCGFVIAIQPIMFEKPVFCAYLINLFLISQDFSLSAFLLAYVLR